MTTKKTTKRLTLGELAALACASSHTWERWATREGTTMELVAYAHALAELFMCCSSLLTRMEEAPGGKDTQGPPHKLYDTPKGETR